jgi:uncharacterized protein
MRWEGGRRSRNIEDRRGRRVSPGMVGGGIGGLVLLLMAALFGIDPGAIGTGDPSAGVSPSVYEEDYQETPAEARLRDFVSVILADTEDTWRQLFQQENLVYQEPTLVLFTGAVQSACGFAQSAVGPFYCPPDQQVYIDLSFFEDLEQELQASGDFAQAYVVAHEIGHHVQNLFGTSEQVHNLRGRLSEEESNNLSVRQELQADCYAGVWTYHANRSRQILEAGDVEEGLNAASAIGDDRLQRQTQGYVVPESFTHGSSAQRVRWFRQGLERGSLEACDTFNTDVL